MNPTKACAKALNKGLIAVIPTDTVYGVVCRADNVKAVKRLYGLKSREHKPGTVIAASIDQLVDLGIKRRYLTVVSQYWPGAVSIEIPHDLGYLSQNTGRQAFRVTKDSGLKKILESTGPLLTSSANKPGQPVATNLAQARQYFDGRVDFYLDGGEVQSEPSTLIRVVDDIVEVLREGAVKINEKGEVKN